MSIRRILLLSLSLLAGLRAAPSAVPDAPYFSHLFETQAGLVGTSDREIWRSSDGRNFSSIHKFSGEFVTAAVLIGDRLVATKSDGAVEVISWSGPVRVEKASFASPMPQGALDIPLATDGREAILVVGTRCHRLGADGTWTVSETNLRGRILFLRYTQGVWVAAGEEEPEPTAGAARGGPGPLALWWSPDGRTWSRAALPERKAYPGVRHLESVPSGFLAMTASSSALLQSADGRTWQEVPLPPGPGDTEAVGLRAAGGKYWLTHYLSRSRFLLHHSADGRTWTPVEVPPGMSAPRLLVDLRGGAWIFGTGFGRYGLLARAETPQVEALPVLAPSASAPAVVKAGPRLLQAKAEGGDPAIRLTNMRLPQRERFKAAEFINGRYVLIGVDLYTSADLATWEATAAPTSGGVAQMVGEGGRWLALQEVDGALFTSADGREWKPRPAWKLAGDRLAFWQGQWWATGAARAHGLVYRVSPDAAQAEYAVAWDGQLEGDTRVGSGPLARADGPAVVLASRRHLFVVTDAGAILTSDNGDYWRQERAKDGPAQPVRRAWLAEGNNRTVLVVHRTSPEDLSFERGAFSVLSSPARGSPWAAAQSTPFGKVWGLAFGGGRFVLLGETTMEVTRPSDAYDLFGGRSVEKRIGLFSSRDGLTWELVARLPEGPAPQVAFGPKGFLVSLGEDSYVVYDPEPLPEEAMAARPATPIPEFKLRPGIASSSPLGRTLRKAERLGDAESKRIVAIEAATSSEALVSNPWRAEIWLKEAAAAGDPVAPGAYADLLARWKRATPASVLADWHRMGAERKDETSICWLAENLPADAPDRSKWRDAAMGFAAFRQREADRQALAANRAKAETGDVDAILVAAEILKQGGIVPANLAEAERLLRRGAPSGDGRVLYALANLLWLRNPQMEGEAGAEYRRFLLAAADRGHAPAMKEASSNLEGGRNSFAADAKKAWAYRLKLAESGDPDSILEVAPRLYRGEGVDKDEAAAERLIRGLAARGDPRAQGMVAELEAIRQSAAQRLPLDGRVEGVDAGLFMLLVGWSDSQAALDGGAIGELLNDVWSDAEYSAVERDLTQEIASPRRPLTIVSVLGGSMQFNSPLAAGLEQTFAQVFPPDFTGRDLRYYHQLWLRTGQASLLVAASRLEPAARAQTVGLIANLLNQAQADDIAEGRQFRSSCARLEAMLTESHKRAPAELQEEFRGMVREALQALKQATGSNYSFRGFEAQAWLAGAPPAPR